MFELLVLEAAADVALVLRKLTAFEAEVLDAAGDIGLLPLSLEPESGDLAHRGRIGRRRRVVAKSDLAATTSVVRTSYIAWSGWFSIAAGYRPDLTQRNDTTEKLVFTPDAGQSATLCGSNAKPIEANLVKETS